MILDIKALRKELGYLQADFAKQLGIGRRTLQEYEHSKKVPASLYYKLMRQYEDKIDISMYFTDSSYYDLKQYENENMVRIARESLGLCQDDFAKRLGVSVRSVRNWEADGNVPESIKKLIRLITNQEKIHILNSVEYVYPMGGADMAYKVTDEKMSPDYPKGSILFLKRSPIKHNKPCVIETTFGYLFCIIKGDNATFLNEKFSQIHININNSTIVYRVIGCYHTIQ